MNRSEMSEAKELKAKKLLDRVELYYAQKEVGMLAVDEADRSTFEPKYDALRDIAERRYGKPSIAQNVAIKRGLRRPISE